MMTVQVSALLNYWSILLSYWRKRSPREHAMMSATGLAVLTMLIYQFPYSLQVRSVAALEAEAGKAQEEKLRAEKDIADLKALAAEIRSRGLSPGPGWQLANPKGVFLLFQDVSGEAKRVGVNVVSVNPAREIDKDKYKELSMNLDLKGRYRELAAYFKSIEELPTIVNIRKIRVEACPDSASVCAAQMEAVMYVEK